MPADQPLLSSGPRSGLPPESVSTTLTSASQPATAGLTTPLGQRCGSTRSRPLYVDCVMPKNSWLNCGTRKPVLYEPRTRNCSVGANFSDTFGLSVVPNPV